MLVYNPQEGGVADQSHHKNGNGDDGVDVLEIAVDGRIYGALWGLFASFVGGVGSQSLSVIESSMRGNAGSCAGTDSAVEVWRMESGVDRKACERVLSFMDLAQTPGHHKDKQKPCWVGHCQHHGEF